jgi:hypothetical protein
MQPTRRESAPLRPRWQHSTRPAPSRRPTSPRKPSAGMGNRSRSGGSKSSRPTANRSSEETPECAALRPCQRMRNWGAHVRVTELRQHRAVDVLDQGMDHALRMHDDLDLLRGRIEQPACLDDLQALVHHGRRVHRDLAAHVPVRMGAGLFWRHLRAAPRSSELPKRPTRGCEQDA